MNNLDNQLDNHPEINNKVLVAEDNLMNQKVIVAILRKEGYEVRAVANGKEAVLALEQNSFNTLILDYQMPELDGYQTLQIIRNHPNYLIKNLPVIFLTAELNQVMLRQIEQLGISVLLPKPLDPKKLIEAVSLLKRLPSWQAKLENKPDISYLHAITDGNRQLMVELIDIFLEEAPISIQKMKVCNSAGDYSALQKVIHKIRSNYKYVGIQEGERLLADLEKDIEQNQIPQTYLGRIESIENLTQEFLQQLFREKQLLQKE